MRNLLLALIFVLAQGQTPVTEDYMRRPSLAVAPVQFLSDDTSPIISTCYVLCGADFLDPANHFDCKPSGPSTVTTHSVLVPKGLGDVCVRGVSLSAPGVVSDPSEFSATMQDVPGRPRLAQ